MDYGGNNDCAEKYEVCLTNEEYLELIVMMEDAGVTWQSTEALGDAEALTDFTWQILFLSPWELIYIAMPMSVLAFYGLSIYYMFKWIQGRFK